MYNVYLSAFSPFAAVAACIDNVSADGVCAVCGSGSALVPCARCPLAFHPRCVETGRECREADGPWFCLACRAVKGPDRTVSWLPDAEPPLLPEASTGLKRLVADVRDGNPIDFVLNATLFNYYKGECGEDWLRCCKCDDIIIVDDGVLAEAVRVPFECRFAYWLQDKEERRCGMGERRSGYERVERVKRYIMARARRRNALFYHGFGEEDRAAYGFDPEGGNDDDVVIAELPRLTEQKEAPVDIDSVADKRPLVREEEVIVIDEDDADDVEVEQEPPSSGMAESSMSAGEKTSSPSVARGTEQRETTPATPEKGHDGDQEVAQGEQEQEQEEELNFSFDRPMPDVTEYRTIPEEPQPSREEILPTPSVPAGNAPEVVHDVDNDGSRSPEVKPTVCDQEAASTAVVPRSPVVQQQSASHPPSSSSAPVNNTSADPVVHIDRCSKDDDVGMRDVGSAEDVKVEHRGNVASSPSHQTDAAAPPRPAVVSEQRFPTVPVEVKQEDETMVEVKPDPTALREGLVTSELQEELLHAIVKNKFEPEIEDALTDMALGELQALFMLYRVYGHVGNKFRRHATRFVRTFNQKRRGVMGAEPQSGISANPESTGSQIPPEQSVASRVAMPQERQGATETVQLVQTASMGANPVPIRDGEWQQSANRGQGEGNVDPHGSSDGNQAVAKDLT